MSVEQRIEGLHVIETTLCVANAMDRLQTLAVARGLTVFARINFSADAARSGLALPDTELMLLGNPEAGTPLIAATPTVAIDLPLRVLAWSDAAGNTHIAYNEPDYLQKRHGFAPALTKNIAGLTALVVEAAQADTAPKPGAR